MRDEGVIYAAGHQLPNRRCTRLPGCFHFPKHKQKYNFLKHDITLLCWKCRWTPINQSIFKTVGLVVWEASVLYEGDTVSHIGIFTREIVGCPYLHLGWRLRREPVQTRCSDVQMFARDSVIVSCWQVSSDLVSLRPEVVFFLIKIITDYPSYTVISCQRLSFFSCYSCVWNLLLGHITGIYY